MQNDNENEYEYEMAMLWAIERRARVKELTLEEYLKMFEQEQKMKKELLN